MYNVLVIDDEAPAREKIIHFLKRMTGDFEIKEAANAATGLQLLQENDFDLMFLDIQMPQMDGFEMLKTIGVSNCPPIIFSTAYNQYALKAFEIHALDYLLKPYDFTRFRDALSRVLAMIDQKKYSYQYLNQMVEQWKPPESKIEILWVNHRNKIIPVEIKNIHYLEADGNYVQVFTSDQKYLIRQSLQEIQQRLPDNQFVRTHRSFIINQLHIREIHPKSHGDMYAILKNGEKVPVSRRYKDGLMN